MIQILTYDGNESEFASEEIVVNRIHDAQSLDEFDVNIIGLNNTNIWENYGDFKYSINIINDCMSLASMIQHSETTKIIFLLPQNNIYRYNYRNGKYENQRELKNMLDELSKILQTLCFYFKKFNLLYENTTTIISGKKIGAAFYFYAQKDSKDILLKSEKSQKPTAVILKKNIIATTLNIKNYNEVMCFMNELKLIQNERDIPLWMEEIKMFDDNQQIEIIRDNENIIKIATENISEAMKKTNKNNEYKSILYSSGSELATVVFEILETMLGCDLSEFDDQYEEDFLFEIEGFTFIGEIKGVNHNVKNENISQLDVHYQGYLDKNSDKNEDQIKPILIMNHQKNKSLDTRQPVQEKQIELARRNGSLIIETRTLLKLFEKYLCGDLSRKECIELIKSNDGLLII